jgi:hypothetical protein
VPPVLRAAEPVQPEPTVIEVTIGRLEIRTPAARPEPQAARPRPEPDTSLQTYLRRRARGELG